MKHLFVFGSFQALFDGQSGIIYYGLVVTCGQITQKAFIVSPVSTKSSTINQLSPSSAIVLFFKNSTSLLDCLNF